MNVSTYTAYLDPPMKELFTESEKTKLAGVAADGQAYYPAVLSDEKTAWTETALRSFSPKDVKDMGVPAYITSVFARTGAVVAGSGDYNADQITDTSNKVLMTPVERTKLAGITTGAAVTSVATKTGAVTLSADDITSEGSTYKRYAAAEVTGAKGRAVRVARSGF